MGSLRGMPDGYWPTWAATLVFFFAFYALLVPLPLHLAGAGLAEWQVGFVLGAFGVASVVLRPVAGALADGWGRRNAMLLGAAALAAGSFGVAATTWVPLLLGLRVSQAAGYVLFTTAATARISDLAPPERRASALAVFGAAANVAVTLAPAAVGAALDALTVRGCLLLSGALAFAGGAMVLSRRAAGPASDPALLGAGDRAAGWTGRVRVPRGLLVPAAAAAVFGVGFGAFLQFLPVLTEGRGPPSAGALFACYGVAIVLTRLATGGLLDGDRRAWLAAAASVALAAGLAWLALAASAPGMLAATLLLAFGSGVLHPALIAAHVERAPPREHGRAVATFYLGFDLGLGAGAWALAPVLQLHGPGGLYLSAALVAGAMVFFVRPVWEAPGSAGKTGASSWRR